MKAHSVPVATTRDTLILVELKAFESNGREDQQQNAKQASTKIQKHSDEAKHIAEK